MNKKNNIKGKEFKLARPEGQNSNEITAKLSNFKKSVAKICNNNNEKMIVAKDLKTNLLKRHSSHTSSRKAMAELRNLQSQNRDAVLVYKEKTKNQYDGYFLFFDEEGNMQYELGLDATLKELNKIHKKEFHLRKEREHKEEMGYIAFAHNSKNDQVVCTRLYATEEEAIMFIQRRRNVSPSTIRVFKVVRYYNGFKFKHQDLDGCRRIKEAKARL